jgi:hypothetical protein
MKESDYLYDVDGEDSLYLSLMLFLTVCSQKRQLSASIAIFAMFILNDVLRVNVAYLGFCLYRDVEWDPRRQPTNFEVK